ncbi:putative Na+/H+ antiporter [Sulfuriroseicoccus oceanibius]|uniref:Putative Na+/H+ antiporter n=1 Tax=Sulfuriroseicoccus oceanibius TaxID=2707525 RepID=A0A6B3KZX9_9BACT|nr:putative Na+/H+ antiporter [Sulfuriroseicoccus oceanibius]QQL46289.1 putative Na+/H+ antiporter [Sulfuriroseicoccus oceanibius]
MTIHQIARKVLPLILVIMALAPLTAQAAGGGGDLKPAYPATETSPAQYSVFPTPLNQYEPVVTEDGSEPGMLDVIKSRATPFNVTVTLIFLLAIIHTFMAGKITHLSHVAQQHHEEQIKRDRRTAEDKPHIGAKDDVCFKATMLHFLGEVEAIFGIWTLALVGATVHFYDWHNFTLYLDKDRNFTEPMFVIVIMAIAASRPVLRFAEGAMKIAANLGKGSPASWWLAVLTIAPVLGSFITEPAAMTIGAMILLKRFYKLKPKKSFAYATLGLLFVNISVGGTLTNFAAPPVLMVASGWEWSSAHMLADFGWKAVIAILLSNTAYFMFFRAELTRLADAADGVEDGEIHPERWEDRTDPIPAWIIIVHLGFLAWTVFNAHHPVLFIGGFLFFLAFVTATEHHQNRISLRSPLLVGFFLAALIVHGGLQSWWIEPIILGLPNSLLMLGSTVLTAFNDNAAITYLASTVDGISTGAQYAVVAGAVTGGGLTVIANAPNPAGQSILGKAFEEGINPLFLALGALFPTAICYICFAILPALDGTVHSDEPANPAAIEQHVESTQEAPAAH